MSEIQWHQDDYQLALLDKIALLNLDYYFHSFEQVLQNYL